MFRHLGPLLHLLLPHLGTVLGFGLAVVLVARMGTDRRPVTSAWAWLLAIVLVPWIGVPLYLGLGGRKLRRRAAAKTKLYPGGRAAGEETSVERLLAASGAPPARGANRCELLTDGQSAFDRTIEIIGAARRTIDLATFIFAGDGTGEAVTEALVARARGGVRVRLLVDAFFAFRASHRAFALLRAAGGQVAFFMPLLLRRPLRGRANLRNHRKLLVVDGETAIAGGMNVADEYMGPRPRPDRWRDVAVAIRGPAALDIAHIFESDWAFATDAQPTPPSAAEPPAAAPDDAAGRVQVVASGPDTVGDPLYDVLLSIIFEARRRVTIATPYFVPDDALSRALLLAVRRGVEMTIIVPARSNHPLADLAGAGTLRDLQAAGVRVRPYLAGMLHAKVLLVDDALAIVGSANFDMRSLFLDFELALLCASPAEVSSVARWFDDTLAHCGEALAGNRRPQAFREGVARLLAPLV